MIVGYFVAPNQGDGYIAGTADGIVTVGEQPAKRKIYVYDAQSMQHIITTSSTTNGHYLITGLDPSKKYLIMCRDYEQQYEPAVYDYVQPATDLTFDEQIELWNSWQT